MSSPTFDVRVTVLPPDTKGSDRDNYSIRSPSFSLLPLSGQSATKGNSGKPSTSEIVKGYSFTPESSPVKDGDNWTQRFKIQGKRITKSFKAGLKIQVVAEASIEGDNSKRSKTFSGEIRVSQTAK